MPISSINPGYSLGRFALYDADGVLHNDDASFNLALGWLYRSQPYGRKPEYDWFDITRDLRLHGVCEVNGYWAVSLQLTRGAMRTLGLALEAARTLRLAGHFE